MSKDLLLLDLRFTTNHPLTLRYSEIYNHALVVGCFAHGRVQPGLSLSGQTPFLSSARVAVAHGLEKSDVLDVMQESLRRYYEQVRPQSATHWLGLESTNELSNTPPWGAVFPWRARTIDSYRKAYEEAAWAENRAVGREVGITDGWLFCGPVSDEKIRIEAERILYVLRRIRANGYQRSDEGDGDVKATALINERHEWRWLITAGNHRASAAAALGMKSIPIRVNLVISRADVNYWKHVTDGLYNPEDALYVFDNFFNGDPAGAVRQWVDSLV